MIVKAESNLMIASVVQNIPLRVSLDPGVVVSSAFIIRSTPDIMSRSRSNVPIRMLGDEAVGGILSILRMQTWTGVRAGSYDVAAAPMTTILAAKEISATMYVLLFMVI
jgi:hypothetical protein